MRDSLKKGALGLLDAFAMAVAGAAPAYSVTASTAALIVAVGVAGPAALCVAFLPMMGVATAFAYLNRWRSDAGAAYTWVGRALDPSLGFMAGWALLCLSTIFMVVAALPAGDATLDLIAPEQSHNVLWATGVGVLWFLAVLAIVTVGIAASARAQLVLTFLEIATLALVSVLAIWNARAAPATAFSWNWFLPSTAGSFQSFADGLLVTIFYFFGWDVSANLAEETAHAKTTAGLGGILGVLAVFGLYLLAQVAAQMALTPGEIEAQSANLLPALGQAALPRPWSSIAVLAVLVSAVATIETQLLQCTRLLFSMARDGVIGAAIGRLHPRFRTPWLAGFAVAGVSLLLFAASATVHSVNELMRDLINAIGVQISFYYALAAFACVAHYRKAMLSDWRLLAFAGIVPLTSGLLVAGVGLYQLPHLGWRISLLSIGSILIGLAPLWAYRRR